MTRTVLFFVLCLVGALQAADVLRIGVVAPLTGNLAVSGQALKNAVVMASEETPEFKTELFFEDTGSSLSGVNLAARRLLDLNKVDVVFTPYTTEANIVAPMCDKAKVIHFSNCWNSDVIERAKLSFSSSVSYKAYSDATALLLKEKGYTRVALVWEAGWIEGAQWLIKSCKEKGIAIDAIKFTGDNKDFRTPILRLKETNPEIWVIYMAYPSCDVFKKQLDELLPGSAVTGYIDIAHDLSLFNGVTYVTEYPDIPEFFARYKARFGESAEQTLAPNAYDNYKMLAAVAKELPKWSTEAAAAKIRQLKDFEGVTGKLTCTPSGVFASQTYLAKIENGIRKNVTVQEALSK